MLALAALFLVSPSFQKPLPPKPEKPGKPAATKPAKPAPKSEGKSAAKPASEPVRASIEQLAPKGSAIVFATPSLAALDRAIAPARAWLGKPMQFLERLTGLAIPVASIDAARPLLVAGSVEDESKWTWTIAATPSKDAETFELAAPWQRSDVGEFVVWTQRSAIPTSSVATTSAIDSAVDLSIRVDMNAALPVIQQAAEQIEVLLAELQPTKGLPGPLGTAPLLLVDVVLQALGNSVSGTLDVTAREIRWTGVPREGAPLAALAAGEPKDVSQLALWIDPRATSWFVGRADPEAPVSASLRVVDQWSALGGGRDSRPVVDESLPSSTFGSGLAISRFAMASVTDRMVLETTDAANVAVLIDKTLFDPFARIDGVLDESRDYAWGSVRSMRVPVDTRTIEILDPGNPGKSPELQQTRIRTWKALQGTDESRRVRAIRDGRVVILIGAVNERDEAALAAPLPKTPRADVTAALAEVGSFPSAFAASMDIGAQIAVLRAGLAQVDVGDPSSRSRLVDSLVAPLPMGLELVVDEVGGFGPDALFLRVRTDFTVLLAALAADRSKRIAKEESGRLKQTVEHKKIGDDMYTLVGALGAYSDNNGGWPGTLADLNRPDAQGLTYLPGDVLPDDPWGRPYLYKIDGKTVVISTLGADGERGGTWLDTDFEKSMK